MFEQFGIAGRIADADIIDRFDNPNAKEVCPNAVGNTRGKVRIFWRGKPCGEHFSSVFAVHIWLLHLPETWAALRCHPRDA